MNSGTHHPHTTWLQEAAGADGRGPRLIARTLFKEMQRSGFTRYQVLAVADELLDCLCASRGQTEAAPAPLDNWEPDGTGD
jgi:hypothetical protein